MVEFETVGRCGRTHVIVNGVESAAFVKPSGTGLWLIKTPRTGYVAHTWDEAVNLVAEDMRTWYTITQAAARLVEMGAFDSPPSAQMMGIWCRKGRFPSAVKMRGKGCRGGGGAWRIPASALPGFMEWRKGK